MPAATLRRLGVVLACACALFVTGEGSPHAALPSAPAALPQLSAVVVDGHTLRQLRPRVLRRLRAERVALVAAPKLAAAGRRRLDVLADRWRLRAFRPLSTASPAEACIARKQARPASRCGSWAAGAASARRISRSGAVDLIAVRAGGAGAMRRLDRAIGARSLAVVTVTRRGGRQLRAAVRVAMRRPGVDIAVQASGRRPARTLMAFAGRVRRAARGNDRVSPAGPRRLRVAGAGPARVTLRWQARGAARRFGVFRNGRQLRQVVRRRAQIRGLSCSSHNLAVDAVDRAGNRSEKRVVSAVPAGCAGGDRGSPSPAPPDPYAGVGARPMPVPPAGPPSGLGHLWIDHSGGSCTRSSSPTGYKDATACGSAAEAYAVANATAAPTTVLIKGGTYSGFSIRGARRSSNWIVFAAAPGERPIFGGGYIGLGDGDRAGDAVDYVALRNLTTAAFGSGASNPGNLGGVYVAPHSTNVRLENLRAGNFLIQGAQNVAVIGGEYGPCRAAESHQECEINKVDHYPGAPQPKNILIDGVQFHDYDLGPSCFSVADGGTSQGEPDCHWRPMYLNGVHDLTLRNSRFRDSFIAPWTTVSGPDAARTGNHSIKVENNVFGTGVNYGNPSHFSKRGFGRWESFDFAWCQNVSSGVRAYDRIVYRFNSASRAVGPLILFAEVGCPASSIGSVTVYGNIGYRNGCDRLVSYAYNVWSNAGTCAATDRNANAGGALPFYASDTHSPGPDDYRLARSSPADGLVPVSAGCPATDRFGRPRGRRGTCDAGSHER